MKMKRMYGLAMVLVLAAMPVWAQQNATGNGQPPANAEEFLSLMQSKLNLTQDQVIAVTPIVEKYFSKCQDLRQGMENGSVDKNSLHAQMKQLKADEKQELSQFLSVQQLNQWEQIQRAARHKHGQEMDQAGHTEGHGPAQGAGNGGNGNSSGGGFS